MHRLAAATAAIVFLSAPGTLAAQCPDGTPPPCPGASRARATTPGSVAVLYFENLSRDTADLYLIDGIAEELTGKLATVQRLRVPGPSVVRRAQQAANGDAMAVGRALNVRYLVEGSLRRSGQRVRVSSRLLRASDGVLVWSDNYDRTINDLLTLQEDIAGQVAAAVAGQLLPGERTALAARPTTNPAAYDHYLRGRYLVVRRSAEAIRQALAEFAEATRLDPRFAAAEARRAGTLVLAYGYGVPLAPEDTLGAWAKQSADRALHLDSMASDVWLAVSQVRLWFPPIDVDGARAAAERSIRLDTTNAEAVHFLGVVLQTQPDEYPAAAAAFQRALAIDPTRAVSVLDLAEVRIAQGRAAEAGALLDSAIAMDPYQSRNFWTRSGLRRSTGDLAGGRQDAELALQLSGPSRIRVSSLAQLVEFDVLAGDSITARRRLHEIESVDIRWAIVHATALAHLGMRDSALAVLRRGPIIPVDWRLMPLPNFAVLRSLPGFNEALAPWRLRRPRS